MCFHIDRDMCLSKGCKSMCTTYKILSDTWEESKCRYLISERKGECMCARTKVRVRECVFVRGRVCVCEREPELL